MVFSGIISLSMFGGFHFLVVVSVFPHMLISFYFSQLNKQMQSCASASLPINSTILQAFPQRYLKSCQRNHKHMQVDIAF